MNTALKRATVAREIRSAVSRKMGREDVKCKIVTKVNDDYGYGLFIGNGKITGKPIFYIDRYINAIIDSGYDTERAAEAIAKTIEDVKGDYFTEDGKIDFWGFLTKERILNGAFFEMLDPLWNKEYLKGKIYINPDECIDMALMARVKIADGASFAITDRIIEKYGIERREIILHAWKNTQEKPLKILPLGDFMTTVDGNEYKDDGDLLWAISNGQYGAAAMCCTDALGRLSEKQKDDLYVIPSSIHEVLTIKKGKVQDYRMLEQMVREINRSSVAREDQLSDSVFLYERSTGRTRRL